MENQETHQKSGIGERVSATWLEFRSMRTYAHESEIENVPRRNNLNLNLLFAGTAPA
jgi:hypothetical protein